MFKPTQNHIQLRPYICLAGGLEAQATIGLTAKQLDSFSVALRGMHDGGCAVYEYDSEMKKLNIRETVFGVLEVQIKMEDRRGAAVALTTRPVVRSRREKGKPTLPEVVKLTST